MPVEKIITSHHKDISVTLEMESDFTILHDSFIKELEILKTKYSIKSLIVASGIDGISFGILSEESYKRFNEPIGTK